MKRAHFLIPRFVFLSVLLLAACQPKIEEVYQKSFSLRAARALDSLGDTHSALYYIEQAKKESAAAQEADHFVKSIALRKEQAQTCIDDEKARLEVNRYPRMRHRHLFQIGVCSEGLGDTKNALRFYTLSANAGSKQPQLFIRRALLLEQTGDLRSAAADYQRAVEVNPNYPPALLERGLFAVRKNDAGKVQEIRERLKTVKPEYIPILDDAMKHRQEFSAWWEVKHASK